MPACLESINSLGAEALVLDSGSTDKTKEIAKKFRARFETHPFKNFSDQRNYADSLVDTTWILSIEADVTISPLLAKEIKATLPKTDRSAFFIPRLNTIWRKAIWHSDWGPKEDTHIWLYRKGSGSWQSHVHEEYSLAKGTSGKLNNLLIHHNYDTISEFIAKINSYSEYASNQGVSYSFWWGMRDFCKRYIFKLGFLDGYHGFFLCYLQSIYYHTLFVKNYLKKQT